MLSNVGLDYRIPQMLHQLGCLYYSPPLDSLIRRRQLIPSGNKRELEMRGTSIWCVEIIRQEIQRLQLEEDETQVESGTKGEDSEEKKKTPTGPSEINAILIDYILYDTMKEMEEEGKEAIPHHRTRSIWY